MVTKGMYGVLDVLGSAGELLTSPEEADAVYCIMIGTLPPGVSVPLHHSEPGEVLSGDRKPIVPGAPPQVPASDHGRTS